MPRFKNVQLFLLLQMLIALGGVIAGYDGSFSFERIGLEFPDSVPYVALRLVSCFCLCLLIALLPGYLEMCGWFIVYFIVVSL